MHWYIYSHLQTDCFVLSELFSVARHAGRSKPESKPVQLYDRLRLHTTSRLRWLREFLGIFMFSKQQQQPLFTFFSYPIGYQRAQFFRRALHYANGGRQFLLQRAQPPWGSICNPYIYIYVCVCVCVCVCIYLHLYLFISISLSLSPTL